MERKDVLIKSNHETEDRTMQRLIDHYKYGLQYQGDATRDTVDALEEIHRLRNTVEALQAGVSEAMSQLPAEDELVEIIDALRDALDMRLKRDIVERVERVLVMLEDKQQCMFNQSEYAREVLNGTV